jgi:hypothetical protein
MGAAADAQERSRKGDFLDLCGCVPARENESRTVSVT